uniref:B12-binding domain-containing radical SAM protein n=1 Tax=Candidatus Electrothrix sp. TaxID=2170559 RepID=UPI004056FB5D
MNILLIRPRPSRETIGLQHVMLCEPLELEYLAASIADQGHQVDILDMILEKRPLPDLLAAFQPDLVAMTGYITHVRIIKLMAETIKAWSAECLTVVGGVHAEVVPEDFQHPALNAIICANGLTTFQELVHCAATQQSFQEIAGVWHPDKPRPVKETSFSHPFPDRSKVARYRHRYYYLFHNPCALLKTSFGCPFHCNFCFCREITDHQYFERPLPDIMEELCQIPEQEIYIVDDNFLVNADRVLAFCDELEQRNMDKRFLIYGRADFIAAHPEVIRRFAANGLRAVIVGIESCLDRDLDRFNKKSSLSINEQAVAVLAEHQVDCYATMILDMDWNSKDFRHLGQWLKKMNLSFVNLQPFTPLKGTAAGEGYETALRIPRSEYEKWDLAHLVLRPGKLSVAGYYWNIIRLYHTVTFRPKSLLNLVRRFGLRDNVRLFFGSSRVTLQYLGKVIRSINKNNMP